MAPDKGSTVVFMASRFEAEVVIKLGRFRRLSKHLYYRHFGSGPVWICLTGIGYEQASKSVISYLSRHKVGHVIIAGLSGAVSPDLKVGDILDSEQGIAIANHPVVTPASRQELHRRGFVAVDMETVAVFAATRAFPVHQVTVLRVVSDTTADDLTPVIGELPFRSLPVLCRVLLPTNWGILRRMWRQIKAARVVLGQSVLRTIR